MKRFRKPTIILASLALLLVMAVGVRTSIAYFTTYAQSEGGETVQLVHWEEIEEDVDGLSKAITIRNPAYDPENGKPTQPVFVRAKAQTASVFPITYSGGAGWRDGGDGWWYYDEVLKPGDATTVLNAGLVDIPVNEDGAFLFKDEAGNVIEVDQNQVNVVVVFESTLALYEYQEDGTYVPFAYWGTISDEGHNVITPTPAP